LLEKPTDALNSNFIGITTLYISGSLSAHHQEFLVFPTPGSKQFITTAQNVPMPMYG